MATVRHNLYFTVTVHLSILCQNIPISLLTTPNIHVSCQILDYFTQIIVEISFIHGGIVKFYFNINYVKQSGCLYEVTAGIVAELMILVFVGVTVSLIVMSPHCC